MESSKKYLALVLPFIIAGCSNAPDSGDIKKNIEATLSCPAISVEDVEKTNGIDQGSTYRVSYTYNMVFPKGAKDSEEFKALVEGCPYSTLYLLGSNVLGRGAGIGYPVEDGKTVQMQGETNMVKSENGWIFQ